jgi:hypothetical protein
MQRIGSFVVLMGLVAGALVGCDNATSIPQGAQQVHVVATTTDVHVDPTNVRAGDVYLVLSVPDSGVDFIQTASGGSASPGPLSEADVARLATGDEQGFSFEALSVSCCGNVYKKTLVAGKYAITLRATNPGSPPLSTAILDVVP